MYISSADEKFDELNTKLQSSKEDFVKLIKEIITEGGLVAFEKEEDCNTFMEEPVVESEEVITENTGDKDTAVVKDPASAPALASDDQNQNPAQSTASVPAQNTASGASASGNQSTPVDPKHPINPATYAPLTVDVNNIDGAISEIETKIKAITAQNDLIANFLNKGKGNGPAQGGKGKSGSTQHKQRRHGDKKSTRRKRKNYRGGVLTPAEEARLGEVTQNLNVVTKKFDRIKLLHEKGFMKGLEDNKIIVEIKKTEKEKAKLEAEKAKLEAEKAKGEEPSIGHAATTIIGTLPGVATAKAFTNATVEATQATIQTVDEIEKGPEEGASAADENVVDTDPSAAGTDPNASSAADTDPSAADTTPLDPVVATKEAEILATEMVNLDKELEKSDSVPSGVGPEEEPKPPGTGEKGDGTPGTVGDGPPGTGPGTGDGPTSTGEKNEDKDKFLPEILEKLKEIGIVDNSDSKGANQMSVEVNLETAKKTYKEFNDFIQTREKKEKTDLNTIFEEFNNLEKEGAAPGEGEEGDKEGETNEENPAAPEGEEGAEPKENEEPSGAEPANEAAPKKEEEKKEGGSKRRHKTKRKSIKHKSAKHKSTKHKSAKRSRSKHKSAKRKSIKRSTTTVAKRSSSKHRMTKRKSTKV